MHRRKRRRTREQICKKKRSTSKNCVPAEFQFMHLYIAKEMNLLRKQYGDE